MPIFGENSLNRVFEFALDASHPIVAQHLVLEQPVLPGLAYIDLLLQLANGQMGLDYRLLAVSKLTIFNPLVVLPGQAVQLKFEFTPLSGSSSVEALSQSWSVVLSNSKTGSQYISAELHPESELTAVKTHSNIEQYQQAAFETIDMDSIYQRARSRSLVHLGMMKAQGQIFHSNDALLVKLTASPAQSSTQAGQSLVCHPALIDGAAMATETLRDANDDSLLLPLYYERFVCKKAMGNSCYALILKHSITSVNDIHKLDIHFYGNNGEHCASLTGMTSKLVRSNDGFNGGAANNRKSTSKTSKAAVPPSNNDDLVATVRELVAKELQKPAEQVPLEEGFFNLGLQSSQMLGLLADIEKHFGLSLSPTLFFEYGNISDVAAHLKDKVPLSPKQAPTKSPKQSTTISAPTPAQALTTEHSNILNQTFSFDAKKPLMADHLVYSTPALMGIVHPCLAFELLKAGNSRQGYSQQGYSGTKSIATQSLQNVVFEGGPITAGSNGQVFVKATISHQGESASSNASGSNLTGTGVFESYHLRDDGTQNLCCRAQIVESSVLKPAPVELASLLQHADKLSALELDELYNQIDDFTIGTALKTMSSAFITADNQLISFYRPAHMDNEQLEDISNQYLWPPLLLNNCFYLHPNQLSMDGSQILVPLAIERLTLFTSVASPLSASFIITKLRHSKHNFVSFDSTIYDQQGNCLAQVENASMAVVKKPEQLDNADFAPTSLLANKTQDIAIVGLSGAYPKAPDLNAFWQNLQGGVDCIETIPASRSGWQSYLDAAANSGIDILSRKGGFIDDIDRFDPLFFTISPREAALMDPQQRLFLEHCWNAIEDGGYSPAGLLASQDANAKNRAVGVYAGVMSQEYSLYAAELGAMGQPLGIPSGIGAIANRVSYFFDFKGPSITLDTMCSSSLSAIALAFDDLQQHKIDAALAGGVNASVHPNKYLMLSEGKFMSRNGRCSAFGIEGDGYIPAEGVGVVLLKRLADAKADGAHIYGVIKSIAVNHGGRTSGFTVPSPASQYQVIADAWQRCDINATDISYIEAHGTGTLLGDPIEINGLAKAFDKAFGKAFDDAVDSSKRQFCAIGSVKSNIGHCESAAGVAGLTKILLQFKHQQLVPSLHSNNLNPNIDFAQTPFTVQQTLSPWTRKQTAKGVQPLLAALSSFGAGGSNAHLVVAEYLQDSKAQADNELQSDELIVLSAHSDAELVTRTKDLLGWLEEQGSFADSLTDSLTDIAYTLQVGRKAMAKRLALVVSSIAELKAGLSEFIQNQSISNQQSSNSELEQLAKRWMDGEQLIWPTKAANQLRRIPLPTYPFNKQRCWLPTQALPVFSNDTKVDPSCWLLTEHWQVESINAQSAQSRKAHGYQLVFLTEDNHQQQLLAEFESANLQGVNLKETVIFVRQAKDDTTLVLPDTSAPSSISIKLNRGNSDQLTQLFTWLKQHYARIDNIYYLWALEDPSIYADTQNLLLLLQKIMSSEVDVGQVWLAGVKPSQHTLNDCYLDSWLTLGQSLKRLYPNKPVACVINHSTNVATNAQVDIARWSRRLLQVSSQPCENIYFDDEQEPQKPERFNKRALKLAPLNIKSDQLIAIRQGGTYIISGGMGGLGQHFARWLVKDFAATVILLGRSNISEHRQAQLDSLNQYGGRALYVQVDVTDAPALSAELAKVLNNTGSIYGVIHGAGVSESSVFADKTPDIFNTVMSAKIEGTLALEQALDNLLAGHALDFFCLFSSLAAVLGDFGGCDYALANGFQQAYGKYRREHLNTLHLGKSLVINWPLWAGDGLDFGDSQAQALYLKSSGQQALDSQTGINIFAHLLSQPAGEYTPMFGDGAVIEKSLLAVSAHAAQSASHSHSQANANQNQPPSKCIHKGDITAQLVAEISEILAIEPARIGHDTNLADFGFDSVTMQSFAVRLGQLLNVTLSPTLFYSHPTVTRLAAYLSEKYTISYQGLEPEPSHIQSQSQSKSQQPAQTMNQQGGRDETIAIIGLSGRFPAATNIDKMWQLLAEGKDAISIVDTNLASKDLAKPRFNWAQICQSYDDISEQQLANSAFAALEGIDEFDPLFFAIAKSEAALIDPRQRLLLQQCYWALEDAAYNHSTTSHSNTIHSTKVGIFVGAEQGGYLDVKAQGESITANHDAMLAARLAYHLDLSGPALVVNTACSSGLVALHQACVNIRSFECDSAVVGAVNLMLSGESFVGMHQAGMLSPDGRCYTFDKRANGMVPGEASVAVVLKRLSLAQANGDPIYATICASGVNQDGRTNGITAPNGAAQSDLVKQVYQRFDIDPSTIDYLVAHGTATQLGDPIEVNALAEVFPKPSSGQPYCSLGSFKTNFGHTFAAAGLVSLVGLVKALEHRQIPACANFDSPSEHIDWQDSPFYVSTELKAWPQPQHGLRRGALSAFGMTGTNAHVVVEEYQQPSNIQQTDSIPANLLVLSARTPAQLERKIEDLLAVINDGNDWDINGLCKTLQLGRAHFQYRLALVVVDKSELTSLLRSALSSIGKAEKIANNKLISGDKPRQFVPDPKIEQQLTTLLKLADVDALTQLADYYCQGYEPDWSLLYPNIDKQGNSQRVVTSLHLPGYPFATESYWRENTTSSSQKETPKVKQVQDPVLEKSQALASIIAPIVELITQHLGLQANEMNDQDSFDDFGLDSINSMALLSKIRKQLPNVSDTLFLEYPTLGEVKTYLASCELPVVKLSAVQASVSTSAQIQTQAQTAGEQAHTINNDQELQIDIVGLAGYFPGANSADEFWQNLCNEKNITQVLPERRRQLLGLKPQDNKPTPHWIGGYLDNIEHFDAERYKLSPDEAAQMDPLLRHLLEAAVDAIEDSGDTLKSFKKSPTGVFVGSSGHSGYQDISRYVDANQPWVKGEQGALYANRISNLLDLKGQSSTMDAGCASFLVAINQAVEALKKGLCKQAVVATGQLYLSPYDFIGKPASGLYSSNGETHSLAFESDGYVRSELIGAIVLKASDKQKDEKQPSYGTIKAVGIAHGGKSPLKWYSPNIKGQKAAINTALEQTDCLPDYIELEANGSQLGDASEMVSIQAEYAKAKKTRGDDGVTHISSFKPLTGHAEAASTFAALVKTLYSLNEQTMLAVPGLNRLNQNITLKEGFEIVRAEQSWPQNLNQHSQQHTQKHSQRQPSAAVHSLSVGGVNAHMIVERSNNWPQPSAQSSAQANELKTSRQAIQEAKPQYWLTDIPPAEPQLNQPQGVLLLKPDWYGPIDIEDTSSGVTSDAYCHRVFCGWSPLHNQQWQALCLDKNEPSIEVELLHVEKEQLEKERSEKELDEKAQDQQLLSYFKKAYTLVQQLLKNASKRPVQLQLILPSGLDKIGLQGFIGLIRSASMEHTGFSGQVIVAHQQISPETMDEWLSSVAQEKRLTYLQFRPQGIWTQNWEEIPASQLQSQLQSPLQSAPNDSKDSDKVKEKDSAPQYDSSPVILITGGLGGIGSMLATKVLTSNSKAQVILSGRRQIDDELALQMTKLSKQSGNHDSERLTYLPCDITDGAQTEQLLKQIVQLKGKISGIYHCAGVNRDAFIVNQSLAEVETVLAPKIAGVNHLDRASAKYKLDFFTLFSSISGVFGNAGQADYAMANAYMDTFAAQRNQLVLTGQRTGHTTAINWPLWAGGGMTVEPQILDKLQSDYGITPLPDEIGVDIAAKLTILGETQVAVTYGDMILLQTRLAKMRFL